LTDTVPKPLAPVNGRPFLAYLVQQLADQGLTRILLLTGYRGEMIRDYFGDGAAFGVAITYSHGPAEWDTGRRIWEAREQLDSRFLLLYSDNYVPVSVAKLAAAHTSHGNAVTLLLQRKTPGNIRLNAQGDIEQYDPSRRGAGLDHVEIGYMVVERDAVLSHVESPDVSFSWILERLTTAGRVGGVVTGDPYHSISDPARWKLAERYLAIKPILMLDRDGTINARPPRAEYVSRWDQFHWIDDTVVALEQLSRHGFKFIVVSNQAGIARGMLQAGQVAEINTRMVTELAARGIDILDVYVCPHHWDDGCACRKPAPGMFFAAARKHLLRLDRTVYVGDDPRDCRAAYNAECVSVLIGPDRHQDPGGGATPALTTETLLEAVPWLLAQYRTWAAWEQQTGETV
jgi:D-glycero-D-manno-heptose 1,7-bisphosphate phosphatase